MKLAEFDSSEMRDRLRGRGRGRWWIDLGDLELTDEQRERILRALHATSGFRDFPFQDTVETVGRAISGTGRSFDETLLHYHALYVGCPEVG